MISRLKGMSAFRPPYLIPQHPNMSYQAANTAARRRAQVPDWFASTRDFATRPHLAGHVRRLKLKGGTILPRDTRVLKYSFQDKECDIRIEADGSRRFHGRKFDVLPLDVLFGIAVLLPNLRNVNPMSLILMQAPLPEVCEPIVLDSLRLEVVGTLHGVSIFDLFDVFSQ